METIYVTSVKYPAEGKKPFLVITSDGRELKGWPKPGVLVHPQQGGTYNVTLQPSDRDPGVFMVSSCSVAAPNTGATAPSPQPVATHNPAVKVETGIGRGDAIDTSMCLKIAADFVRDDITSGKIELDPFSEDNSAITSALVSYGKAVLSALQTLRGQA